MKKKLIFEIAKKKDIKNIMRFIKKYWDKKHILANNIKFFCYEYKNKKNINFILARGKNQKIEAIQGFILYGSKKNSHVCGSMTCVRSDSKKPFLGIEIMKKMLEITRPKTYCGIGTNPQTMIPLVKKFLNRHVGIMDHYYILNYDFKN